jgi:hypothetical protein
MGFRSGRGAVCSIKSPQAEHWIAGHASATADTTTGRIVCNLGHRNNTVAMPYAASIVSGQYSGSLMPGV